MKEDQQKKRNIRYKDKKKRKVRNQKWNYICKYDNARKSKKLRSIRIVNGKFL